MKSTLIFPILIVLLISGCSSPSPLPVDSDPISKPIISETKSSTPTTSEPAPESPPPAAAPIQEVKPETVQIQLSSKEMRKINIFLSNFAECALTSVDINTTTDAQLIDFALWHNYKNNSSLFKPGDEDHNKISATQINSTIKKYFDIDSVKPQSVGNYIVYQDGWYFLTPADGEALYFVQVESVKKTEDGVLQAKGSIYWENGEDEYKDDPYIPLDQWAANEKLDLEKAKSVTATLKEVTVEGKSRYTLLTYNAE